MILNISINRTLIDRLLSEKINGTSHALRGMTIGVDHFVLKSIIKLDSKLLVGLEMDFSLSVLGRTWFNARIRGKVELNTEVDNNRLEVQIAGFDRIEALDKDKQNWNELRSSKVLHIIEGPLLKFVNKKLQQKEGLNWLEGLSHVLKPINDQLALALSLKLLIKNIYINELSLESHYLKLELNIKAILIEKETLNSNESNLSLLGSLHKKPVIVSLKETLVLDLLKDNIDSLSIGGQRIETNWQNLSFLNNRVLIDVDAKEFILLMLKLELEVESDNQGVQLDSIRLKPRDENTSWVKKKGYSWLEKLVQKKLEEKNSVQYTDLSPLISKQLQDKFNAITKARVQLQEFSLELIKILDGELEMNLNGILNVKIDS